ncbi:MAG: T9SS C-terminal target domain-containing protein [Bacteroidetes bacterium]|nr:MAG: T9SS C-terminal target domain-containing protein [Bacteroidota bacterium]
MPYDSAASGAIATRTERATMPFGLTSILAGGVALLFTMLWVRPAHAQEAPEPPVPAQSLEPIAERSEARAPTRPEGATQAAGTGGASEPVLRIQGIDRFSASDASGGNDYRIRVDYEVSSPCVFPESISIKITSDGGRTHEKSWTSSGRVGWVEWGVGPSVSDKFYLKFSYKGWQCDNAQSASNRGSTAALKAPGTLRADAQGSDQNVRLTWSRGSTNTPASSDYYLIYRDGTYVGWTRAEAYTVATTPSTENTWAIERRYGSHTSSRRSATATTSAFKAPADVAASDGTTVRKVALAWDNPSDYARETQLYRDGTLRATLPANATTFEDTDVIPGETYSYCLANRTGTQETESVCAEGASFFIRAADGTDVRNVRLEWTPTTAFPEADRPTDIRIERGEAEVTVVSAASSSYLDRDGDPGVLYPYRITLLKGDEPVLTDTDYGFLPATGEIRGRVTTRGAQQGGVAGVRVSAVPSEAPLSYALVLDGDGDYVHVPYRPDFDLAQSYTLELWVRPTALGGWQTLLARGDSASTPYRLALDGAGRVVFQARQGTATVTSASALSTDAWHHIAAVHDEELAEVRLYVNGAAEGRAPMTGTPVETARALTLGALPGGAQPVTGVLDEVRVWSTARSDSALAADRDRILVGDEPGLVAYWRFDQGTGSVAGDVAHGGGHTGTFMGDPTWTDAQAPAQAFDLTSSDGQGEYRIRGLFYEFSQSGTLYEVVPSKENHAFDPGRRFKRLTSLTPLLDDAHFTDTTSVSVSGLVRFAHTECAIDSVEIHVNDVPLGLTDADGAFVIGGLERKEQTFRPVYRNHAFDPATITRTLDGDVSDLLFEDTTTRTLRGFVAGGTCKAAIGRARVTVTALDGCYSESVETSDRQYSFTLPAQAYTVEVEMLDDPTISFAAQEVSLADSSRVQDFIYYAPPRVAISGLPTSSCGTPVLEQGLTYELLIDVLEDYGATTCPATVGTLEVIDGIGDDAPLVTHELDSTGVLRYTLEAGVPNIVGGGPNPYLKRLEASASTPGGDQLEEALAYVEGNRPREQTFTTVSPQIPLLILRDPPGDQSYSYKEEARSSCYASSLSLLADASVGVFGKVKAGTQFETEIFGVSFETKVWGELSSSLEVGARLLSQTDREICVTHTNRYSTSGNQDITGQRGDVFVGAALNLVYALTDVLEVSEDGGRCRVELSKSIIYDNDGFATQYHYTESHIRNTVIPDLELNRELATDSRRRQEFEDQVEVWKETLALNERLKARAVPMGDNFNLSFSANAPTEQITEWSVTDREAIQFNLYVNSEIAREAGVEIGGVGASGGVRVRASLDVGTSETVTTTTTNRTGFYLADDDAGDAFSVDVKRDPVYGTPVFDLVSGVSSTPWEPGTLPRDGVALTLAPATQTLTDPSGTAEVILSLGNTGQNNEGRDYELVFLQESNPDAARIEIGGSPYQGPVPYALNDSEARQVTLRLTRAPSSSVYDYDDLQLVLRAPSDPQFADTASFSVHFESPCSPITLAEPVDGWVVNGASNDALRLVVQDYQRDRLQRVRIEQTPAGQSNWATAATVLAGDLPDGTATLSWNVAEQADRAYAVRAVAECDIDGQAAVTHSPQATGTIDRQPPKLFGTPGPTDGILTGDTFTAAFNEPLACGTVTAEHVVLKEAASGERLAAEVVCSEREIAVTVAADLAALENATVQVSLVEIADRYGNVMPEAASWSFRLNRNPVYWTPASLARTFAGGTPVTLSSTLANRGTEAASFSLTQFPDWLTPARTRGTLEPGTEQLVAFDVAATLEPGTYTGEVVASTPGGAEPLRVTLDVLCEASAWDFDPEAFAHTMRITAGLYVGGAPFADAGDRVAALVDGDVRGVAEVQRVVPQDEYAAFLTVYSNASEGETLSFVLFDASECETRSIAETVPFEADGTVGSATTLHPLTVSGAVLQVIDLLAGWTWISLGVEATDMATETVLRGMNPAEGSLVKGQTGFSQYVSGAGWVGSLDTLRSGALYKIQIAEAEALQFAGEPVPASDRPLAIAAGWNWIGYLPDASLTVDEALATLAPTAAADDLLKGQFAFASHDGSGWQGSLQRMLPGEGYLLQAQNPGTLTYPGSAGEQAVFATRMSARALLGQSSPDWSVDAAQYEHSMTLTGAVYLADGRTANPDLLLVAFAGEEVRGLVRPTYVLGGWVYFLTLYGTASDEALTFRIYDGAADATTDLEGTVSFQADATHGTPRDPYALRAATATAAALTDVPTAFVLEASYPNPFNPQTTIRYAVREAGPVRLEVFDALGRRVAVLVDEVKPVGWHQATFEAGSLASGVYLYRIEAGAFTAVRQMVLMK